MEWTRDLVDRLYSRYLLHIRQLRDDVEVSNRLLGAATPNRTALEPLGRHEFEQRLLHPCDDPIVTQLWIKRIIRGHEAKFSEIGDWLSSTTAADALRRTAS